MIKSKPIECEACKGRMRYLGGGLYKCQECSYEELDDYGKVKKFLQKHGPTPALVVSEATGVKREIIEYFLKKGRVEIPEGSKYYLKCEKCGCALRYGRYCPGCIRETANNIREVFNEDVGEIPKYELNPDLRGKIHFLDRK